MYDIKAKFKIGDLVVIKSFAFVLEHSRVKIGDIGIIAAIDDAWGFNYYWGIDYMVLVNGEEIVFFEDELELFKTE